MQNCGNTEPEIYQGHDLDLFCGQVTSSVTWPFDSPCGVSYRSSMVILIMRLSCTVMEIWSLKYFRVMTLTFWGHVTIGLAMCYFLLVVYYNQTSISCTVI